MAKKIKKSIPAWKLPLIIKEKLGEEVYKEMSDSIGEYKVPDYHIVLSVENKKKFEQAIFDTFKTH